MREYIIINIIDPSSNTRNYSPLSGVVSIKRIFCKKMHILLLGRRPLYPIPPSVVMYIARTKQSVVLYIEKKVYLCYLFNLGWEHSSITTPIKRQKDAASAQACNQHETGIKGGILVIKQLIRRQTHVLASILWEVVCCENRTSTLHDAMKK